MAHFSASTQLYTFLMPVYILLYSGQPVFKLGHIWTVSKYISTVFMLTHLPKAWTTKTGFGQVKIKKEFVSINKTF
jgi:hypothetical protein